MAAGKSFQTLGPQTAKGREPSLADWVLGTNSMYSPADLRPRRPGTVVETVQSSAMYGGAALWMDLCTRVAIL